MGGGFPHIKLYRSPCLCFSSRTALGWKSGMSLGVLPMWCPWSSQGHAEPWLLGSVMLLGTQPSSHDVPSSRACPIKHSPCCGALEMGSCWQEAACPESWKCSNRGERCQETPCVAFSSWNLLEMEYCLSRETREPGRHLMGRMAHSLL